VHRHVIATYVGTDDSGASEADPFMQTHFLQQIQGGQQIGSIEIEMKCKTQYLASSAGLPESAGNPNACRVGGAKGGGNTGHARRAVRRLRQRGLGTARPGNSSSLPMVAVWLARACLPIR
jgi:hypothetical protein